MKKHQGQVYTLDRQFDSVKSVDLTPIFSLDDIHYIPGSGLKIENQIKEEKGVRSLNLTVLRFESGFSHIVSSISDLILVLLVGVSVFG